MGEIKNVLGLELGHIHIIDKFIRILAAQFDMAVSKLFTEEGLHIEKEASHIERRMTITQKTEYETYEEALNLIISFNPAYKKYLPKSLKGSRKNQKPQIDFTESLKKKIRLALWVKMGNEIPFGELKEDEVKKFLKQKGYVFRRKKGELGWWYQDELYIGKKWHKALEHLESIEKIDRKILTINF